MQDPTFWDHLGITGGRLPEMYASAAAFILVNFLIDSATKRRGLKVEVIEVLKKLLAYLAFLVIANRLDVLVVDSLFGWHGSSQMLVCLYIIGREVKFILTQVGLLGVAPPPILERRINDLIHGQTNPGYGYGSPSHPYQPGTPPPSTGESLDREIYELQQRLKELQSQAPDPGVCSCSGSIE